MNTKDTPRMASGTTRPKPRPGLWSGLLLTALLAAGCATPFDARKDAAYHEKAGSMDRPVVRPVRSISSFSDSLMCMDHMLRAAELPTTLIASKQFPDYSGKVPAAIHVSPAADGGGAVAAVVVLGEGQLVVLAVDFARGGDQHLLAVPAGQLEQGLGALDVRLHGGDRLLDDELHAHRRRQVEDHVGLLDEPFHHEGIEDAVDGESETRVVRKMRDVFEPAGGQVVDYVDLMPLVEQVFTEVRADETGATRDQVPHLRLHFTMRHPPWRPRSDSTRRGGNLPVPGDPPNKTGKSPIARNERQVESWKPKEGLPTSRQILPH